MNDSAIVIVGGGYAGSVLALALAERALGSTVIERDAFARESRNNDTRHFGLTRDSRDILQCLGLWSALESRTVPVRQMTIRAGSDHPHRVMTLGQQHKDGASIVGRMVAAGHLQDSLRQAVHDHPLITTHFDTVVTALEETPTGWNVGAEQGQDNARITLAADLIVAADGAQSPTRDLLGISTCQRPYHQFAWQWRLTHSEYHHQRGFEHLLPEGPYVVLPRQQPNQSKLIWCHSSQEANLLETQIARYFPCELGEITDMTADTCYPLQRIEASRGYKRGAVLIGDAYLRVHPVGAQGLNLGLRDAWALAEHIAADQRLGIAIGVQARLAAYHRARRQDRWAVKWLTDTLGHRAGRVPPPLMALAGKALQTTPAKRLVRELFHGE